MKIPDITQYLRSARPLKTSANHSIEYTSFLLIAFYTIADQVIYEYLILVRMRSLQKFPTGKEFEFAIAQSPILIIQCTFTAFSESRYAQPDLFFIVLTRRKNPMNCSCYSFILSDEYVLFRLLIDFFRPWNYQLIRFDIPVSHEGEENSTKIYELCKFRCPGKFKYGTLAKIDEGFVAVITECRDSEDDENFGKHYINILQNYATGDICSLVIHPEVLHTKIMTFFIFD